MDILEKIFKLIRPYVTESKKIITILICILILQTLLGIFYTRSLKKNLVLGDDSEQVPLEQLFSP